jgi:hypothetical protein
LDFVLRNSIRFGYATPVWIGCRGDIFAVRRLCLAPPYRHRATVSQLAQPLSLRQLALQYC